MPVMEGVKGHGSHAGGVKGVIMRHTVISRAQDSDGMTMRFFG